jgi:hypothetical protein
MGSQVSICDHKNLKIKFVQGLKELDYENMTSYKPTFANFTCPDCKMDCYRKRTYYHSIIFGTTPNQWESWVPKNESEKCVE